MGADNRDLDREVGFLISAVSEVASEGVVAVGFRTRALAMMIADSSLGYVTILDLVARDVELLKRPSSAKRGIERPRKEDPEKGERFAQ